MKFTCLECREGMAFRDHRGGDDGGAISASFRCPSCEWGFEMDLNPQETRMVGTLGIQFGEVDQAPPPMAMMRHFLSEQGGPSEASGKSKCPFSQLVNAGDKSDL